MSDIHIAAQQSRSRKTEEKIAAAARALLRDQPFDAIRIPDIAARAGVSVGGFYARFPSKEALVVHIASTRVFDELERQAAALFDETDATVEDVVRRYLSTAAALYRRNRALLRAVYVATRTGSDDALRARVRGFNIGLHERLRGAILDRCRGARQISVNLAILSMMSTLREVVLFGQPVSDLARLSETELIRELTRQFLAAADCKPARRKTR